ncbi:beta-glucosidase [Saccharothrix ecbatanensis]|uniref:Beta-glucosidase n=1 Tax=Saccharothrix ecbatanensis TaxID=1105145 RepID=A0A7W9M182_9PSEU|nr:glycoside hydrolase family 3 N-terminal domain-containing protein [Saccharothrix ecbatanensis]MBB5803547.1 beta-glucosidase [Saccharothrix ecbatanensis]
MTSLMNTDSDAAWRDRGLPVHDRVEALLATMTLEEKVAQLGSVWLDGSGGSATGSAPVPEVFTASAAGDVDDLVRGGIGHLIRVFGTAPVTVAEGLRRLRSLQERVVAGNRFGIPAIVHEECVAGFATFGATVYPTPLAWAAGFDVEVVREVGSAIGRDLRSVGVHQTLASVLDVVRDYRSDRVEETLGEDPYLVAQLGAAYVRGLEEAGVIATVRHFTAYASSRATRNRALVGIGLRELADVVLPPFETALREGGARSVMSSCTDVDGVPVAANAELLRDLLSEEWAFTGTVVADHRAILFVASMERAFAEEERPRVLPLRVGGELPETRGYGERLVGHVRSRGVEESLVDESVRRVLRQKVDLGLLDGGPPVPVNPDEVDLDSADNRWLARTVAERSVVLLANDRSTLPLDLPRRSRIAVIGSCANDPLALLGRHAFPHHALRRRPGRGAGLSIATIRQQVEAEFPQSTVHYARGVDVTAGDDAGITQAVHLASLADVALLFVGDRAGLSGDGTERGDVSDLSLPGSPDRLVEAVLATGTPTVLVVVSGRPYALGDYADRAAAVVQVFFPGVEGASAVAGVLSGRINPSGRLPVQVPRQPWAYPSTYLHPLAGAISALDPTPLYPFGHGLSYTTVRYETLGTTSDEATTTGSVEARVVVRNTGHRAVDEVVQLYASDPVAPVVRPPVQLIGFARVALEPGQTRLVVFDVPADAFSFTGVDGRRVVEPGRITLSTGPSSADLPLSADVWLSGEPAHPGHDRRLTTTHDVRDLDELHRLTVDPCALEV